MFIFRLQEKSSTQDIIFYVSRTLEDCQYRAFFFFNSHLPAQHNYIFSFVFKPFFFKEFIYLYFLKLFFSYLPEFVLLFLRNK